MQLPDQPPHPPGKILDHAAGLGEADGDMVEQRARELAEIDGLDANDVNEGHRYQARQELRGADDPTMSNDDGGAMADLIERDDILGESGSATAPATNAAVHSDEESIGEALYTEGINEADHDRMTQSRQQEREEDAV